MALVMKSVEREIRCAGKNPLHGKRRFRKGRKRVAANSGDKPWKLTCFGVGNESWAAKDALRSGRGNAIGVFHRFGSEAGQLVVELPARSLVVVEMTVA